MVNKHMLLQAAIHDLGDENNGLQVRGYRNQKIICSVIEALKALDDQLMKEEQEGGGDDGHHA